MKKILSALALSAVLLLTACGGGAPSSSTAPSPTPKNSATATPTPTPADKSWDDIKAKGVIVLGLDDSFPPMGFRDDNDQIVGFDIDLANAVGEKLGLKIELKPIVWDSKMLELNGKNIDVIWNGFSVTPDRTKEVTFSKPYISSKQVLVVSSNSPIKSKADLAGKKVGLQGGSSAEDAFKKDEATYKSVREENISDYKDNVIVLTDLSMGRLDAVIMDEVVARYLVEKNAGKYVVLDDHFGEEDYAVGFRLADKAFAAELQKALDELKAEGKSAEISEKWFGKDIVK